MQKVAILLVALGQEAAGEVMKLVSDFEIDEITQAVANLKTVSVEMQDKVMEEFEQHLLADRSNRVLSSWGFGQPPRFCAHIAMLLAFLRFSCEVFGGDQCHGVPEKRPAQRLWIPYAGLHRNVERQRSQHRHREFSGQRGDQLRWRRRGRHVLDEAEHLPIQSLQQSQRATHGRRNQASR